MIWEAVFDKNIGAYLKIITNFLNEECRSQNKRLDECIEPLKLKIKGKLQTKEYSKKGKYPIIDQGKKFIIGYIDDENYVVKNIAPIIVFGDHTRNLKYIDFDFALGADGVKLLKPIKKMDAKFFYYQLFSFDFEEKGYSRYYKQLSEKELVIPFYIDEDKSLEYQKKIVHFIEALKENRVSGFYFKKKVEEKIYKLQIYCVELFSLINNLIPEQQTYLQLLRQTILQEAIQGKLSKQSANDEPAIELLKRIKAEKQKLIKAGKLKKEKELSSITEDEIPFELPEGWVWCRLGEIFENLKYGTSQKCNYTEAKHAVLRIPNLSKGVIDLEDLKFANLPVKEFSNLKLQVDDMLVIRSNGSENLVGRTAVFKGAKFDCAYAGYLIRLRFNKSLVSVDYIHQVLESRYIRNLIEFPLRTTSGVKNINSNEVSNLLIPLPPLSEQNRIVAKVQQLQEQLTQLEAQVKQSRQYAQQLLQSVLREAFEEKGQILQIESNK